MLDKSQFSFVVIGDLTTTVRSGIGGDKTALAALLSGKTGSQQLFDEGTFTKSLGSESVVAKIINTAGSENLDTRFANHRIADVFILIFAITKKKSFQRIQKKWNPELKELYPNTPVILVGVGKTYRLSVQDCVTLVDCQALASQIGARGYFEIDLISPEEVSPILDSAFSAVGVKIPSPKKVGRPELVPKPDNNNFSRSDGSLLKTIHESHKFSANITHHQAQSERWPSPFVKNTKVVPKWKSAKPRNTWADSPLPQGWEKTTDSQTGCIYYYNKGAKTTTWEHPLTGRMIPHSFRHWMAQKKTRERVSPCVNRNKPLPAIPKRTNGN